LRLRYKILPNRIQLGNISPASAVAAGHGCLRRFTKSTHFVVPTVVAKCTSSPGSSNRR
jgi:hypothetical protein